MRSAFFYNGKSSLDFGVCVEKCPRFVTGTMEYEKVSIPGRNGDLIRKSRAKLSNYIQPYEVWFSGQKKDTILDAREISNWLLSAEGYVRLEDTYDSDVYREALFTGPMDVENWMLVRGRTVLEFDCKPQRWLKSGEYPIAVESGTQISNPWHQAKPEIVIAGTGAADIRVGSSHVHIADIGGRITLDCDVLNAYDGLTNKNNLVTVKGGWPVLNHGETEISWSGGIQSVTLIPHWWMP